jgi:hypothetical protein
VHANDDDRPPPPFTHHHIASQRLSTLHDKQDPQRARRKKSTVALKRTTCCCTGRGRMAVLGSAWRVCVALGRAGSWRVWCGVCVCVDGRECLTTHAQTQEAVGGWVSDSHMTSSLQCRPHRGLRVVFGGNVSVRQQCVCRQSRARTAWEATAGCVLSVCVWQRE